MSDRIKKIIQKHLDEQRVIGDGHAMESMRVEFAARQTVRVLEQILQEIDK